jgi:hypothetical protein
VKEQEIGYMLDVKGVETPYIIMVHKKMVDIITIKQEKLDDSTAILGSIEIPKDWVGPKLLINLSVVSLTLDNMNKQVKQLVDNIKQKSNLGARFDEFLKTKGKGSDIWKKLQGSLDSMPPEGDAIMNELFKSIKELEKEEAEQLMRDIEGLIRNAKSGR